MVQVFSILFFLAVQPLLAFENSFLVKSFAAGGAHVCALSTNDQIKCWGRNNYGQLGQGDTEVKGDSPNELENFIDL